METNKLNALVLGGTLKQTRATLRKIMALEKKHAPYEVFEGRAYRVVGTRKKGPNIFGS